MTFDFPKILSAAQTRAADEHTIQTEPISSTNLMERASNRFVEKVKPLIANDQKIAVLAGMGNNGGDALAVARLLRQAGYSVDLFLVRFSEEASFDNLHMQDQVEITKEISSVETIPDLQPYDVLIDGLFGTGLSRPIEGWLTALVDQVNAACKIVYAIDIPSGMYADKLNMPEDLVICCHLAVTFQRPKKTFFFPESGRYLQHFATVNIGLIEDFIQRQTSNLHVLNSRVHRLVKQRTKHSHKGTYGHALIVAGAYCKMGAAVLSASACYRSGAGLVTVHVPRKGVEIVQIALPEAMCQIDDDEEMLTAVPPLDHYDSIAIGPGLGTAEKTHRAVISLLKKHQNPLVIDADAINIIANENCLADVPKNSILTPHPKEFERLVGPWKNSEERLSKAIDLATKYQVILVLKDAYTTICLPTGECYFNTTGNAGMATGGSGDVLTGIITGLLAQGYTSAEAAIIGVYFHGLAGDEAAEKKGENALLASDIVRAFALRLA